MDLHADLCGGPWAVEILDQPRPDHRAAGPTYQNHADLGPVALMQEVDDQDRAEDLQDLLAQKETEGHGLNDRGGGL